MQTALAESLLDGQVRLTEHAGYLTVNIVRNSENLTQHRRVRNLIEAAIETTGRKRILLRSTHGQRAPDEVREAIFKWLTTSPVLERVALIVPSEPLASELNMKGMISRRCMRAFTGLEQAEQWLLSEQGS